MGIVLGACAGVAVVALGGGWCAWRRLAHSAVRREAGSTDGNDAAENWLHNAFAQRGNMLGAPLLARAED